MRSLLTALVSDDQLSVLFTSLAVGESMTLLSAAPLMQLAFSFGLQKGGLLISLPFFIVASLYGGSVLLLAFITFR